MSPKASSIDLLPDITYINDQSVHLELLAINSSDTDAEMDHYLRIQPVLFDLKDPQQYSDDIEAILGSLTTRIHHSVALTRAEYMPLDSRVIAALDVTGDLVLHTLKGERYTSDARPEYTSNYLRLQHRINGKHICWNPHSVGELAVPSVDGYVFIHNVNRGTRIIQSPDHNPTDISWSSEHIFGTVGGDGILQIWDLRTREGCLRTKAHDMCGVTIDFSPFDPERCMTGEADCTVALWDSRNISGCLSRTGERSAPITHVSWSPHYEESYFVCGKGMAFTSAALFENVVEFRRSTRYYSIPVNDTAWHPVKNIVHCVDDSGKTQCMITLAL